MAPLELKELNIQLQELQSKGFIWPSTSPWGALVLGKLAPRYIGPFEILQKIGEVANKLALPPQLLRIHDVSHVSMLRKYEPDTTHVLDWQDLNFQEDVMYEEGPREILDKKEQVLRTKTIPLVKVFWDHHGVEGATWELESDMRNKYLELFTG
ncbi:hypothetical protein AAG906_040421 [Vitis piasezkii]